MSRRAASKLVHEVLRTIESDRRRSSRRRELRQEMVELNVLRAFGSAVTERLERPAILEAVRQYIPKLFDDSVLAVVVSGEQPEVHVYAKAALSDDALRRLVWNLVDADRQVSGKRRSQKTLRVRVNDTPRVLGLPSGAADATRPQITLPLISGGESMGCISVMSRRSSGFGALHLQLLSLVAYQLAAALRNAALLKKTWELAIRDPLTNLFNRRHFDERFTEEYRRAQRYRHPMVLLIADVDDFKSINDRFGHPAGDRVLCSVADVLTKALRTSDILCRYGGEEFAAVLPETTIEEGILIAERIRQAVEESLVGHPDVPTGVRISMGVAGSVTEGLPMAQDVMVARADGALYLAKRSGKNRVCAAFTDKDIRVPSQIARIEKRRFPRIRTKIPLRYLVVPDLGENAHLGTSVDLSTEGVRFNIDRPLPGGAFVLMELQTQGKAQPLRILSKVVWSRPDPSGQQTLVGTRIVASDEATQKRYGELLQKRLASSLGKAGRKPKR